MKKRLKITAVVIINCAYFVRFTNHRIELEKNENIQEQVNLHDESRPLNKIGSLFNQGLLAVKKDGKFGYIDKFGRFKITPQFSYAYPFSSDEMAIVKDYSSNKYGYIDLNGKYLINPVYDKVTSFKNEVTGQIYELAMVSQNEKIGYINKSGEQVISCKYLDASYFDNGVAFVKDELGWRLINSQSNLINDDIYDSVTGFSNNLACVSKNSKYYYIARTGEVAFGDFLYAEPFYSDIALIQTNLGYTYINKSGELVGSHSFEGASSFSKYGQYAKVYENGKYGLVNKHNVIFTPINHDFLMYSNNNLSVVTNASKQNALMTYYGVKITDYIYDEIIPTSNAMFIAKKSDSICLLNQSGQETFCRDNLKNIAHYNQDFVLAVTKEDDYVIIDKTGRKVLSLNLHEKEEIVYNFLSTDKYYVLYDKNVSKIIVKDINRKSICIVEEISSQFSTYTIAKLSDAPVDEIENLMIFFTYLDSYFI